jgi:hypothetical protein
MKPQTSANHRAIALRSTREQAMETLMKPVLRFPASNRLGLALLARQRVPC